MHPGRITFLSDQTPGLAAARGLPHVFRVVLLACLLATRAGAQPDTATGPTPTGLTEQAYFQRLVEKIEPGHLGTPERIEVYLQFFRREMVNDTRLFAFDVQASWTPGRILRLSGYVEFEENRATLETFLHDLGFDLIDNQIQILPASELGKKSYGLIRTTHALCRAQPAADAEVVTDSLLGDPVFLLRAEKNGYFLCHTAEGYVGYLHEKNLVRVDTSGFKRYQSGSQVTLLEDCVTPTGPTLPVGARLKWIRNQYRQIVVELPSGDQASLSASGGQVRDGRPGQRVERAIDRARQLLGTPYLWGGRTSAGIDCSGLVQVAFASEGVNLPRDSSQQVSLGRLTATRWFPDGMRRGDTLYFLGPHGKITHTAIYLGADQYLESAGPGVRISSLNPTDPNFDARRSKQLAFAKRLLE